MFTTFSQSTWLLVSCVTLWTVSIALFFIFRFSGKKAMHRGDSALSVQEPALWREHKHFGDRVQHELLCQHIDTVFDSLSEVVEAERIKLKALIAFYSPRSEAKNDPEPAVPPDHTFVPASVQDENTRREPSENKDIASDISQLARQGMSHDEISRQLGISRNEVILAAKMISSRGTVSRTKRLRAVA